MRIKEENILETVSMADLPEGFQWIGEICSLDFAKELILKLGGQNLYIPQITNERLISPYIKKRYSELFGNGYNTVKINQILVSETGLNMSTVRKILKTI